MTKTAMEQSRKTIDQSKTLGTYMIQQSNLWKNIKDQKNQVCQNIEKQQLQNNIDSKKDFATNLLHDFVCTSKDDKRKKTNHTTTNVVKKSAEKIFSSFTFSDPDSDSHAFA